MIPFWVEIEGNDIPNNTVTYGLKKSVRKIFKNRLAQLFYRLPSLLGELGNILVRILRITGHTKKVASIRRKEACQMSEHLSRSAGSQSNASLRQDLKGDTRSKARPPSHHGPVASGLNRSDNLPDESGYDTPHSAYPHLKSDPRSLVSLSKWAILLLF